MTRVYFVRHAQPEHDWKEDRTRPLTEEGKKDSAIVLEFLKDKKIDAFLLLDMGIKTGSTLLAFMIGMWVERVMPLTSSTHQFVRTWVGLLGMILIIRKV